MRHAVPALVALSLFACVAKNDPSREQLKLVRVERAFEFARLSPPPERPADDHVFMIVHLIEDPPPEEKREWIYSTLEDWDGRTYRPKFANVSSGESEQQSLFGTIKTVNPDQIQIIFEVPQTATLRKVTVPHPISLLDEPGRPSEPGSAPKIVRRVEPLYPESARRWGIQGLVKLEVLVLPDGTVGGARPIHGHPVLCEAAAAAVRQWKYEPLADKTVPALIEVSINFRVDA